MTIRTEDRDDWIDMRADALFEEYKDDAEKIAEADEWCEGVMDADWYDEVQRRMADLHGVPELSGTDLLANLYRLAKPAAEARAKRLRDMAEQDAEDEWKQGEYDAGEARAWAA